MIGVLGVGGAGKVGEQGRLERSRFHYLDAQPCDHVGSDPGKRGAVERLPKFGSQGQQRMVARLAHDGGECHLVTGLRKGRTDGFLDRGQLRRIAHEQHLGLPLGRGPQNGCFCPTPRKGKISLMPVWFVAQDLVPKGRIGVAGNQSINVYF